MSVKLRLARRGCKHRPVYHIVAVCSRRRRDGGFLERLGLYDPRGSGQLAVDEERVGKWIRCGAQMSPTVKKLLKRAGVATVRAAEPQA